MIQQTKVKPHSSDWLYYARVDHFHVSGANIHKGCNISRGYYDIIVTQHSLNNALNALTAESQVREISADIYHQEEPEYFKTGLK